MPTVLSYQEFISGLHESLDPFMKSGKAFKIGDDVIIKDKIGKVTAFDGTHYLILVDSKNQRARESELEKLTPTKKKSKKPHRKKRPIEKDLNL